MSVAVVRCRQDPVDLALAGRDRSARIGPSKEGPSLRVGGWSIRTSERAQLKGKSSSDVPFRIIGSSKAQAAESDKFVARLNPKRPFRRVLNDGADSRLEIFRPWKARFITNSHASAGACDEPVRWHRLMLGERTREVNNVVRRVLTWKAGAKPATSIRRIADGVSRCPHKRCPDSEVDRRGDRPGSRRQVIHEAAAGNHVVREQCSPIVTHDRMTRSAEVVRVGEYWQMCPNLCSAHRRAPRILPDARDRPDSAKSESGHVAKLFRVADGTPPPCCGGERLGFQTVFHFPSTQPL